MADIELPNEEEALRALKNRFQKLFEFSRAAWRCASLVLVPEGKIGIGKGEFLSMCLTACYVKATRLFYSIYRLCERGLGDETNLPLRALFELYVRVKFLATKVKDKNDFARQWVLWCMANDHKFLEQAERHFPDKRDERFNDWKKNIQAEKQKMTDDVWKKFLATGPWQCNFASLCEKVGLEKDYPMYALISGTSHGYDLFRYVRQLGRGVVEMDMSPIPRSIRQNLVVAISLLHSILHLINAELGLDKSKQVDDIGRVARMLMNEGSKEE